jgi:hypothetical protein
MASSSYYWLVVMPSFKCFSFCQHAQLLHSG